MKIIIDLDDTITIDTSDRDYSNKHVNKDVVAALRQAKRQGYSIHIFTARNIRTYENDLEAIHKHTKLQLSVHVLGRTRHQLQQCSQEHDQQDMGLVMKGLMD